MKTTSYRIILTLILGLVLNQYNYSEDDKNKESKVEITYIANAGFLIKIKDKEILIDALFGDQEYEFCDIPDKMLIDSMIKSKGVFSDIDLIVATHRHVDHFYAPFISAHLKSNRNGKFISCQQAIDNLVDTDNYSEIEDQLIEITPDSLTYIDTAINGINIKVYRLIHGPYYVSDPETGEIINRHRDIQNLGFLFTINGIRIFHSGDSNPSCISDYEHFRLDKENIDIAFLGGGFMWSSDCQGIEVIQNYIKPRHIVLMHIHHNDNQKFIEVTREIEDEFPGVMVFQNRMDTKSYILE